MDRLPEHIAKRRPKSNDFPWLFGENAVFYEECHIETHFLEQSNENAEFVLFGLLTEKK